VKKIELQFQNGNCEVGLGGSLGIQVVVEPAPCKAQGAGHPGARFTAAVENPRPSGAWTGHPRE